MDRDLAKKVLDSQTENNAVDILSLEDLSKIDIEKLLTLRFLESAERSNYHYCPGDRQLVDENGIIRYCYDNFTPRSGTVYLKPSFAGRQVVMGMVDGIPVLSNGVWFRHFIKPSVSK
jgi:hypothetical protein